MTKLNEIYRCEECGNVVEVVGVAGGELFCCHQAMILKEPQTADAAVEKHVPVIEGSTIKVGTVPHPMEEAHHICWIEIINGDYTNRKYLAPGDEAKAEFYITVKPGMIVREFCNIHGLWEYKA